MDAGCLTRFPPCASVADAYFWTLLTVEAAGDEAEDDLQNLVRDKVPGPVGPQDSHFTVTFLASLWIFCYLTDVKNNISNPKKTHFQSKAQT